MKVMAAEAEPPVASDIGGHLAVVLHGLVGLRVPVQADMAHLGGGDHLDNAIHHTQAGPEDGDDGQLLARQGFKGAGGDRGLDLDVLQRQVPGGLVALQSGDLGDDLPEFLHPGALVPEDGQLVLKQRMVQDVYLFVIHVFAPLLS